MDEIGFVGPLRKRQSQDRVVSRIDAPDEVAGPQAGALGRRAGINRSDPCAVDMRTSVRRRKSRGH